MYRLRQRCRLVLLSDYPVMAAMSVRSLRARRQAESAKVLYRPSFTPTFHRSRLTRRSGLVEATRAWGQRDHGENDIKVEDDEHDSKVTSRDKDELKRRRKDKIFRRFLEMIKSSRRINSMKSDGRHHQTTTMDLARSIDRSIDR